jgi:ATP-dependent RNA helicase SrmB
MTVTTFSELELDENLLEALQDKGFTRPTAIQAAAIPPALDGRDILGSAPTGTGKTAAYLLPALQHLLDFPRKKSGPPRILILTPTRELAMQVADHARELAKHTHLDIATITGGVAYMNHAEVFSENQDIVVATTGRLLQYIKEENFDCRAVETLILDEADRMLDMGFAQDIETSPVKPAGVSRPCCSPPPSKAMRLKILPSVCWKSRLKFPPPRPPASVKNSSVVLPRR